MNIEFEKTKEGQCYNCKHNIDKEIPYKKPPLNNGVSSPEIKCSSRKACIAFLDELSHFNEDGYIWATPVELMGVGDDAIKCRFWVFS